MLPTSLLRLAFHLLYNQLAWSYDLVSWVVSLGAWRDWQQAALPFVRGSRVLELAHGPGHMLAALQGRGFDVVGLDLSPFMGRQAQRRLRRLGLDVALLNGRAQQLPFTAASFDTVLATFPTEFIVDPTTLTAVARVLRPGGRFVIVPEGRLTGRGPLARLIEWLYGVTGQREGTFATDADGRWRLFEEPLSAADFRVEVHEMTLAASSVTVIAAVSAAGGAQEAVGGPPSPHTAPRTRGPATF